MSLIPIFIVLAVLPIIFTSRASASAKAARPPSEFNFTADNRTEHRCMRYRDWTVSRSTSSVGIRPTSTLCNSKRSETREIVLGCVNHALNIIQPLVRDSRNLTEEDYPFFLHLDVTISYLVVVERFQHIIDGKVVRLPQDDEQEPQQEQQRQEHRHPQPHHAAEGKDADGGHGLAG